MPQLLQCLVHQPQQHIAPILAFIHWLLQTRSIDFKIHLVTYKALHGYLCQDPELLSVGTFNFTRLKAKNRRSSCQCGP